MAESVVSFVMAKLGDAYVKEVLHLQGVGDQMERVRRELSRIQAFLKDTDRKRIIDERQSQLVKEVRDLAYRIEDVIDTLLTEVPEKKPGKIEAVKRWLTGIIKLPTIHRQAHEINKIEELIQEIEASRLRYGITKLGEDDKGTHRRIVLPDVDEDGIVGFEADRDKIIDLLLDEKNIRRSVVSIVGPGGLGKTTLARKVYNSEVVKRHFDVRIWVVISQKFELIDIFKNIAKQLKIRPPEDLSEHELTKLHQSLTKKRYLLVLDDIWKNNNPLTQIDGIFPDSNNRSRVLITTRLLDVAEKSGPISIPYKLQFLTEESSIKLLLKKALPSHNADEYPHNFYNIGKQFAKKCGGLPLALVVLGGLLSKKDPNYVAWSSVIQTMNWGTDGEECTAIIGTSYDDLPFGLKSCFMYFAAFPEDADIKVRKLLRMWIAEGFIPQEQNRTLEDTAHSFLVDLVQRSMIQATGTDFAGYILRCRIHDLLHGLAIQKAKDDNFLMVCSKIEELQNYSQIRRLAIHDSNYERDEELYAKVITTQFPNLRSLFTKQLTSPMIPQHIKVWSDFYWTSNAHVFKKIERSSQLRYLELTIQVRTRSEEIRNFQEFIGGMRFLQTLDLQFSTIECDLPESLWHVKTLRNVILPFPISFTNGPTPSLKLINLQTLRGVKCRESWGEEGLPDLPNLRSFAIITSNQSQWNAISNLMYTLKHLIILSIHVDGISLDIIDMRDFPCYHRLQFLHFYGNENKINLDLCMLPIHLNRLVLENLQFQKDPMPLIEKLENLKFLWLKDCKIQQLCCLTTRGFGRLESLTLEQLHELEEWEIEDGAMPVLKTLDVIACARLRVPPGLQHLTVLQELTWDARYNEISDTMENEIRSVCKHVPAIKIIF